MRTEVNLSDHYRMDVIRLLAIFSDYFRNQLSFKQMTRNNLLAFLDSFRKPEGADPLHKWIGTTIQIGFTLQDSLNGCIHPISSLMRGLNHHLDNIARLKRKETSIYKASDLWIEEDDALFLKHCPSKRIRCYHAVELARVLESFAPFKPI